MASAKWALFKSAVTGALGGLLFGFDTAVIAGATRTLTQEFHLSPAKLGITVSIALWGTVLGALTSGWIGQKIGSRSALRWMAVLYVASALGSALAWGWWPLMFARFIGGLAIGGSSVVGPVYIAELAPAKLRGRLVGLFQVMVITGIMLAYLSNAIIGSFNLGLREWRWELGIAFAPAVLFMVMLFVVPQSSRWLITQSRLDEARAIFRELGADNPEDEVREIVDALKVELAGAGERVFSSRYSLPIFLAVSIGFFNQMSGINAILYYLNDIFASAGFTAASSAAQAAIVGAVNAAATLIATSLIDKLGRKTLLLIGSAGTSIVLCIVAWVFLTGNHLSWLIGLLVIYIFFFAALGAVIWVYISEVFPTTVRSKGQSIGAFSHWFMAAVISGLFPVLAAWSKGAPFLIFAGVTALQFVIVLLFYPETANVSLEAMQAKLSRK